MLFRSNYKKKDSRFCAVSSCSSFLGFLLSPSTLQRVLPVGERLIFPGKRLQATRMSTNMILPPSPSYGILAPPSRRSWSTHHSTRRSTFLIMLTHRLVVFLYGAQMFLLGMLCRMVTVSALFMRRHPAMAIQSKLSQFQT